MSSTAPLSQLSSDPTTLLTQAIQSALLPASGVVLTDLNLAFQPGKVVMTPAVSDYTKPGWNYYGTAVASYQPADMTTVLGDWELRLLVTTPTTTYGALAAQVGAILGVNLKASDVVDGPIDTINPGMTVVLRANPDSLMWSGQRSVRLYTITTPYTGSLT